MPDDRAMQSTGPGDAGFDVRSRIVDQFRKPTGVLGTVAGWIMANRSSNVARNHWTVSLLSLPEGAEVLEIGCGPGIGIEAVLQAARSTRITALDHSEQMIAMAARRHAAAIESGCLQLLKTELQNLEKGHLFDAIFSCNVMQFVNDRPNALALVSEHLKVAGVFATTYQPRGQCATAEEGRRWIGQFAEDLCRAEFRDVDVYEKKFGKMPAFCALAAR
ncbi:methyltransferase [Roseibium sp. SCPC15]|uniref:class I SAM-dependent methyltransferase n=1 Tax=Roseibium sp. SCP15 TaxID=3141376 RepID=UPI00333D7026